MGGGAGLMRTIGLKDDYAVAYRPQPGTDAEGNPNTSLAEVWTGWGRLGSISRRDAEAGGFRGDAADAVLAVHLDSPDTLRDGDVIEVRGERWTVKTIEDVRRHFRVMLGKGA